MILFAYENKKLGSSLMNGIINLIPKGSKDSKWLKNLRPVPLLNTDYKIIEKTIANKILIISSDQRGF